MNGNCSKGKRLGKWTGLGELTYMYKEKVEEV
jgi:hypothetical protein